MKILHICACAVAGCFLSSQTQAKCLEYEPIKVTLTGVISTHVDPGPPGYGEDPKRDAKEEHLYLKLDKPVCVSGRPNADLNVSEANITSMQMVYFHIRFQRPWFGKHVSVSGTLFHAISGHHWTAVLIDSTETHVIRPGSKQ